MMCRAVDRWRPLSLKLAPSWWGRHAPRPSAEVNSAEPPPTRRRWKSPTRELRSPSKPFVALVCIAGVLVSSGCGTNAPSPAESEANLASATEALAIKDPATPLAVTLPQAADPLTAGLAVPADAPQKGMWSATQPWPLNGLHSVLLPDGKVLTFGTPTGNAATQDGRYFDVWTAQGFGSTSHQTSFQAERVNSFCAAAAYRLDGTLLVAGGNSPLDSNLFSATSGSVATSPFRLADERWYASLITLPGGQLLIVGGSTPYGALQAFQDPNTYAANGAVSMTPELYDASTGWRSLFGAQSREAFGPDFNRYWYPRAWVAPNGKVFGISSEKMWYLDPSGNGAVTVAGNFKTAASATTRPNIGPTSAAVMFAPGRILQVGGNGYHDGHAMPGSELATVVDITGGAPVVTETAPMTFRRHWPSATVLPDGRVVVTGGTQYANNGAGDAVYPAELWNPASGTWTLGASAAQIRVYHSAAILMPNGAVLSTGGGAPGPVNNLNAELYFPPYFFRPAAAGGAELAPRPQLTAISALVAPYGAQVDLDLASNAAISKVILIGTSAVTHSFNSSQRRQELVFLQGGNRLAIGMPASANEAPPGYYLLFAIDSNGVPSRSVILAVGTTEPEPPAPTLLPHGSVVTLAPSSFPDYAVATGATGLGIIAPTASTDPLLTQFVVRDGLADPNCATFESVKLPGQVLRHDAYRLKLGVDDGSSLFKNDATFCPEPGLDGAGITLRSKNFPDRVLRQINQELWLDPVVADAGFAADATFEPDFLAPGVSPVSAPVTTGAAAVTYTAASPYPGTLEYQWNFGDGTGDSGYSSTPTISHAFASPGVYTATLTVKSPDGALVTTEFVQGVAAPAIAGAAVGSSNIAVEVRAGQSSRLWVVNIDNDSVSVFDGVSYGKVAEITVGSMPRSVAVAPSGAVWVTNKGDATLSVIDPVSLTVNRTVTLPRASQPFGAVVAPNGDVFVALEGLGRVLKLDAAGTTLASLDVGPSPRHLALTQAGAQLLVSRFITPPQPGEGTATVQTTVGGVPVGGEVLVVDPALLSLIRTIKLQHSSRPDSEVSARGVPNYLGAAAISRDGKSAFIPSKQDNILRGRRRDQNDLDFQTTVRAISSRIDLTGQAEDYAGRIDHDNSSVASAAVYDTSGVYLLVALETSREIAVVDAYGKRELFRVDAGRAPQGLAMSPDGRKLYVHNALDRSAGVYDLSPLLDLGRKQLPLVTTLGAIAIEKLSAQVLTGKRLFYDARDTRLSRDSYLSCATCHNDGGHDGRTWDLTSLGEGLRNTISLRGRAGAQGRLHWSANFDEVQDFEGQIRALSQGTGLMTDAAYNTGTRNQPLGNPKLGISADLDALAAYVSSLSSFAPSPYRTPAGGLGDAALTGRSVFAAQCVSCHGGSSFSDSATLLLRDVGTIKPSSGSRLDGSLLGLDTPTLRDVWLTAPYLHDGSAASISAAIQAHKNLLLTPTDLANVAAFTQQIGAEEAAVSAPVGSGLVGQYFANATLSGAPVLTRTEAANFDWGTASPGAGVPADSFSVRWTGQVSVTTSGSYVFQTISDDGVRLYLNGAQLINNWTDHGTTANNSASLTLVAGQRYDVVLEYYEKTGGAVAKLNWQAPGTTAFVAVPITQLYPTATKGLLGQYFTNATLSGNAVLTRTEAVNFDWGTGSPGPGVGVDGFSARWKGQISVPASGSYVFQTVSDDGVRLWINGAQLINNWTDHAPATNNSAAVTLSAGQRYDVTLEYYERTNGAVAKLNWQTPGTTTFVPIPASQLYPTAQGLLGQYFTNTGLTGTPALTRSEAVNYDWGTAAPATGLPVDGFSVRWSGRVAVLADGNYTFQTTSDDGVRLWVNGNLIVDNWTMHATTINSSAAIALKAGFFYDIKLEYFESQSGAVAKLAWIAPGSSAAVPVPQSQLYGY
jgi:YVTN family beta-propeller protein